MANPRVDRICPAIVGEDRIKIDVPEEFRPLQALQVAVVTFDYSAADPEGIVLPVVIVIQPEFGTESGYIRKLFSRSLPSSFTFKPIGSGPHQVLIKECQHNQWQGRLSIDVQGDPFSEVNVRTRF